MKTTLQGAFVNDTSDLIDTDALLFIGRPLWFDKHPSQAEGEDF